MINSNIYSVQTIDRAGMPLGEWQAEPDLVIWVDEDTGLLCEIGGTDFDCHGGVTYNGECEDEIILLIRSLGFNIPKYLIGFDCAHAGDLSPYSLIIYKDHQRDSYATYKNIEYVKAECIKLAKQLKTYIDIRNSDEHRFDVQL